MKRGDIWTVSGPGYAGKPRAPVIIQDDRFGTTATITVCPFTRFETEAELFRLVIEPAPENGLRELSRLMVDKLTTMPRQNIGRKVGELGIDDLEQLDRAILIFLGLVAKPTA